MEEKYTAEEYMGIFNKSMDFELALHSCLEAQKKYLRAITEEEHSEKPEVAFLTFCEESIASLDRLRRDLRGSDARTIALLLDRTDPMFKFK